MGFRIETTEAQRHGESRINWLALGSGLPPSLGGFGATSWALGGKRHAPGRCGNRQARTPTPRGRVSGFGPANGSMFDSIPWGKGAMQREQTGEKAGK